MSSDERCEVCRYWLRYGDQNIGYCRRYPPLPVVNITSDEDGNAYSTDAEEYQPKTGSLQWCGEFERKEGE